MRTSLILILLITLNTAHAQKFSGKIEGHNKVKMTDAGENPEIIWMSKYFW